MHVRVVVVPLIGDLSIHFSQCHRGCKIKKPKGLNGEELDGWAPLVQAETLLFFFFICLHLKGHHTSAAGEQEDASAGVSSPVRPDTVWPWTNTV